MKYNVIELIGENQIVAIARGIAVESIVPTAKALYAGGIRALEITFNQREKTCIKDTANSIRLVKEALGETMCIGAGTVMTVDQAKAAAIAGADFALAPNTDVTVINEMIRLGMTAIPGAMTPSEISEAYQAGAGIVKLFPAGELGLNYVKAVRGPINHIPLMAVGGIDLNNVKEFLDSGFHSVGVGSNIVKNSYIVLGQYEKITDLAKQYMSTIRQEG